MDRGSYQQELIDVVRLHKQSLRPVENLPEEQMAQLESSVYEHIDQQFSGSKVSPATVKPDVIATGYSQKKGSTKKRNSPMGWLFPARYVQVLAMALISAVVVSYLLSINRASEMLFDIPASVVAADVDRYIEIPQQNLRALTGTSVSDRRGAFLAGVTQANLDLIDDTESATTQQMALWYHHIASNVPTVDVLEALKTVHSSVYRFSANEQTSLWLKIGYAIEVVHLAAKRSMVDLNTSVLADALQFYSIQASMLMPEHDKVETNISSLRISLDDINRQYILNHERLIVAHRDHLITPAQVQQIVDMTDNMKILLQ